MGLSNTTKEELILAIKMSDNDVGELTREMNKINKAVTKMNRDITETTLKQQRATKKGAKRLFRSQALFKKEKLLEMKREADFSKELLGQEKDVNKEFKRMNNDLMKQQQKKSRMDKEMVKFTKGGKAQGLLNEVSMAQDLADKYDSFGGSMAMSNENLNKMHKGGASMNTTLGKMGMRLRMATSGLKGFKMELLGVMFFGMGVMSFFTGLLKPSADLFGIFDLWSILLSVTFLPVMTLLFDIFMKFFNWVLTWDEDTKMFVGTFVLLGAAIGGVLFFIGMMGLGIGSLIEAFGFFGLLLTGGAIGVFALGLIMVISVISLVVAKQDELKMAWYNTGIVGAAAFRKIAKAALWYANFRKNLFGDPTGVWEERIQEASGVIGGFDEIIDEKYNKWKELSNGIASENDKQSQSVAETTAMIEKYNKDNETSHNELVANMEQGNNDMVKSTFDAYVDTYSVQTDVYAARLASTRKFVNDTNVELAKIGKNSGSTSYNSTNTSELQTAPGAIQSLMDYVNRKGSTSDIITMNNSFNINESSKDSIARVVVEEISKVSDNIFAKSPFN